MIYIFIAFILLFLIYLYDIGKFTRGKHYALFFIWLIFTLTAGLSYRVGIDAIRYAEDFIYQPTVFELPNFNFSTSNDDPLWVIFSSLFRTISNEFILLHLFHAIIVNGIIFYFIYKNVSKPFTAILIYFLTFYLFFNFETLRESLAVAVFLFAYKPLVNKQWVRYYLFALVAFFIHSSASFTFFIPLLIVLTKIKNVAPIVIIGATFTILGRFTNEIVLNILPLLNLSERIAYKLSVYLGRDEIGISTGLLLKNVFFPIVLLSIDKFVFKQNSRFTSVTKLFLMIGIISMTIPVVDRLLNYLIVIYILHVTETIFKVTNFFELKSKFLVLNLLVLCFTFAPLSWLFTIDDRISEYNYNRYFPYSFFIFGDKNEVREKFYISGS